jgi:hypothetical protein
MTYGIHRLGWSTVLVLGLLTLGSGLTPNAHAASPFISHPTNQGTAGKPVNYSKSYSHGGAMEFHTAYIQQPRATGNSQGFLGLRMQAHLGDTLPEIQAELDYGSFNSQSSLALNSDSHRSFRLSAEFAYNRFRYGANYQSTGRDFVALAPIDAVAMPGKNRTELWTERQVGQLGIRTFAWYSEDQHNPDPAALRLAESAIGTRLNYRFASAPYIDGTLSYSRQLSDQVNPGLTRNPELDDTLTHNIQGAVTLREPWWNATASTTYAYKPDYTLANGNVWESRADSFAATFTPYENLSLSPRLTYQIKPEPGLVMRTHVLEAALALEMRPWNGPLLFTATSSLAERSNAAWQDDAMRFKSRAAIEMPFSLLGRKNARDSLSVQIDYSESSDAYASNDNVQVNLEFSLYQIN